MVQRSIFNKVTVATIEKLAGQPFPIRTIGTHKQHANHTTLC